MPIFFSFYGILRHFDHLKWGRNISKEGKIAHLAQSGSESTFLGIGGYGAKDGAFIHPTNNIQQKGDKNMEEKKLPVYESPRWLHTPRRNCLKNWNLRRKAM